MTIKNPLEELLASVSSDTPEGRDRLKMARFQWRLAQKEMADQKKRADENFVSYERVKDMLSKHANENLRLRTWLEWRAAWTGSAAPHDTKGTPWYRSALDGDAAPKMMHLNQERK